MPTTNGLSHMVPMEGEYFILENIFFFSAFQEPERHHLCVW